MCATAAGCHGWRARDHVMEDVLPHEMANASLPRYVISPPDVLLIDAIQLIPRPPYKIAALDVLIIQSTKTFPEEPIAGPYTVEPEGTVNLGFSYGSVHLAKMTLKQAREAITKHLSARVKDPEVMVVLGQSRAVQYVRGEHLVRPDGTVGLGVYGSVNVAGLNLDETRAIIQSFLSEFFQDPEVSVDVLAYNSRAYYVITDGGGQGEQVLRFPITGSETVLDAVSRVYGLSPVSSKHRVWLVRPTPSEEGEDQVFAVDWQGVTKRGRIATNYQVFPGDRIYIGSSPLVTVDTYLARVISPMERLLGVTLLGNATVRAVQRNNNTTGSGF
jgi:protein involved in polysaccharide export with SLBB domain